MDSLKLKQRSEIMFCKKQSNACSDTCLSIPIHKHRKLTKLVRIRGGIAIRGFSYPRLVTYGDKGVKND